MDLKNSVTNGAVYFDRGLLALEQANYSIEQRSSEDWLLFLKQFASRLTFFDTQNGEDGTWAQLLPNNDELKALAKWLQKDAAIPDEVKALAARPDLSLLLTFIQLLNYPAEQFHELTARHLQHYYRGVLGLAAKKGEPDKANLIVTLNEDTEVLTLREGTRFSAGVDDNDEPIEYALADTVQLNTAQVSDIITLAKHSEKNSNRFYVTQAQSTSQQLVFPAEGVPCFGENTEVPAELGLIISSKLLWLGSGKRQIHITFSGITFTRVSNDSDAAPDDENDQDTLVDVFKSFDIAVSTEQGKVVLPLIDKDTSDAAKSDQDGYVDIQQSDEELSLVLTVEPEFPAIGLSEADVEKGRRNPYICLFAKQQSYQVNFAELKLQVSAEGLVPSSIANDQGELEADNPDLIFGPEPVRGSGFYFTHPELNVKPLANLKLDFNWAGKPQDMRGYYDAYKQFLQANPIYQMAGFDENQYPQHLVRLDSAQGLLAEGLSLFEGLGVSSSAAQMPKKADKRSSQGYLDLPLDAVDPKKYPLWFKLSLTGDDFGTGVYGPALQYFASLYAAQVLGNVNGNIDNPVTGTTVVPEPYIPQALDLHMGYHTEQVKFDNLSNNIELGHIHPLGEEPIDAQNDKKSITLQPQIDSKGELIIGLVNPRLPGEVSLLLELEPLNYSVSSLNPTITWHYRYQNKWHEIKRNSLDSANHKALVLSDSTNGLLNSGIVRLALPEQASLDDAMLQSGRAWIKASISYGGNRLARLSHLKHLAAQAVEVTYVEKSADDPKLGQVLPAESINELVTLDARVDSVMQPAESFAGRAAQSESNYVTHCAEQLRHKGRALTQWDYEHLVLEAFPELYFVKCFRGVVSQATTDNASTDNTNADDANKDDANNDDANVSNADTAGTITLVAIPKTRDAEHFQPLLADHKKKQIAQFLADKMPHYAKLDVVDPDYREIRFSVTAVISDGYDKGQALERINATLIEHMSPWIEKSGKAPQPINNNVSLSSVAKIIAQLDEIKLIHSISTYIENRKGDFVPINNQSTQARNEHEVLVPAVQHVLRVFGEQEEVLFGIGAMVIEADFTVAQNDKVAPPTTN
ncbi:hypothetical protein HG263_08350 [Pseudoalteromonas sp. JBTF-M23]|uniref:Baseplate J-like protein n=1 Tax=Pseudoalteromonas caenipelagi TaxID=2726988 RepID=A0A849VFR6_9GAMM|nr:hypothetical protein [Pseudoalteromonas caenipelagi]NOU50551.1 hypothetical protein [Pseudoalteromonas caenipelagi]